MSETEAALSRRLRRSRVFATALLVLMLLVFLAASALRAQHTGFELLRAFAEAAMVGALADWFAVTALFRRPLGLPIPHTAIVPARKDAIGRALAQFIRDHFLVREAVEERLARVDLGRKVGAWLADPDNAHVLSRDVANALTWLLGAADSGELRLALKQGLRETLERVPVGTALATMLDVLGSGAHMQTLIDQLVHFGREQLHSNKARIRERVRERSPWWLPNFVDEHIYDQLVGEFERILGEIGDDPDHEARARFNARMQALRDALLADATLGRKADTLRDELFRHPAVGAFFADLTQRVREELERALGDPRSAIRLGLERQVRDVGEHLLADPHTRAQLNRWLRDLVTYLVQNYREQLSGIISGTIAQWDATATAERIELYIGRDLQFIRINGTLVGGLVGVTIYLLAGLLPW